MNFVASAACAETLDAQDELRHFRNEFHFPESKSGRPCLYFCGNSLGLQPKNTKLYIERELEDWARFGVEGHFHARSPWYSYHETLTEQTARLVGAKPLEVVVMNSLTTNLHLLMVSFYRPTKQRFKILVEAGAFPSDQYAVASQAKFHGFDSATAIVELHPRAGEDTIRTEDIVTLLEKEGHSIALVLLGGVNFRTGQAFDIPVITKAAQKHGAVVGLDLAHAAGNLKLALHDWNVDFAAWCSYKYLNAGPGGIAGCFVHERHATQKDLPRFAGWWGHNKQARFQMHPDFDPIPGAQGWQLSNPPIFQMAALRASMEHFDKAGMDALRKKSESLTGYLEFLIKNLPVGKCSIITPPDTAQRGCQLSLRFSGNARAVHRKLTEANIVCDFREPDVIRVSPVPLYNSHSDVFQFFEALRHEL